MGEFDDTTPGYPGIPGPSPRPDPDTPVWEDTYLTEDDWDALYDYIRELYYPKDWDPEDPSDGFPEAPAPGHGDPDDPFNDEPFPGAREQDRIRP